MIRKLLGRSALLLALPSAAVLGVMSPAPSAMGTTSAVPASTPALHFDDSPGFTNPPPRTLGPYDMRPAAPDTRQVFAVVEDVTLPNGTMTFSQPVSHLRNGVGWFGWGGPADLYFTGDTGTTLTMTLPPGTEAFYFYAQPSNLVSVTLRAVAQDGTSSGDQTFVFSRARYFGFYGTGGETVETITVTATGNALGFAVGQFGVGSTGGDLSDLLAAVQGVGPGRSLAAKVMAAESQLARGNTTAACGTLGAFINQVRAQTGKSIPANTAQELLSLATDIRLAIGC